MFEEKNDLAEALYPLILAILFITSGNYIILNQLVATGKNSRTLAFSGFGGYYLILFELVFLLVAYFSLSPSSKIRKFIKNNKLHKNKRK